VVVKRTTTSVPGVPGFAPSFCDSGVFESSCNEASVNRA
jgi:hypothetical protein